VGEAWRGAERIVTKTPKSRATLCMKYLQLWWPSTTRTNRQMYSRVHDAQTHVHCTVHTFSVALYNS